MSQSFHMSRVHVYTEFDNLVSRHFAHTLTHIHTHLQSQSQTWTAITLQSYDRATSHEICTITHIPYIHTQRYNILGPIKVLYYSKFTSSIHMCRASSLPFVRPSFELCILFVVFFISFDHITILFLLDLCICVTTYTVCKPKEFRKRHTHTHNALDMFTKTEYTWKTPPPSLSGFLLMCT